MCYAGSEGDKCEKEVSNACDVDYRAGGDCVDGEKDLMGKKLTARKGSPTNAVLAVRTILHARTIILATQRVESASAALDILETHEEKPKTHVRNGQTVGLVRAKFWQTDPQHAFAHSAAQHAPFAT
ncbi:hypothetical protein PsorP6_004898 [Peronosclerospora sorghi]|uniref:Uncharacterized protein n=1 Tax=Peronosclerospora sorghi TaxID=230839 RepID=A0ACC0W5T9_9STRA|nr:hypothetical protein PsorP6_004898 [Peronosclerospora sorghi]